MHCPSTHLLTLLTLGLSAAAVPGQQVVFQGAIQLQGGGQQDAANDGDIGPNVEMFESPNLDRFLRRARQFLQEEKYQEAILVLQTVVEGRTLEATSPDGSSAAEAGTAPKDEPSAAAPEATPPGARVDRIAVADPAQTVFSADGRIYRPARRLCHEYLSGMPASAVDLYRAMYEARAEDLLRGALASGQISDLERVANRYFPTLAAGRAMQTLADRLMHEGRHRAAVQVLRDLVELYPPANLVQLGVSPLWCWFKIALCLRMAGEVGAALDAARVLAGEFPDESLRLMGELQPVRDLPTSPLFVAGAQDLVADVPVAAEAELGWLDDATEDLVPLWQYRFAGPNPYAGLQPQSVRGDVFFLGDNTVANAAPPANKYGTGTQVAFLGRGSPPPRAVFLENFRLRVADAFSGLVRQEGDGEEEARKPQEMRPRPRVPVYDLTLMTPVEDELRYYVVLGRNKIDQSVDVLRINELVAYDKATCQRLWSSNSFREGDDGLADVTILAAPTVFGERLLLPVLRRGAYELQCLDRRTGMPLWRTRVHGGGSVYFKAPGARVVVGGSLAYIMTNAGAIAAVDAFAGDLRWVRKYERTDPLRQQPIGRRPASQDQMNFSGGTFVERDLTSFLPSEVLSLGGTIVFAGCDSEMVLCVDGASGEPVWMIDGNTRYAPYGRIRYLLGANSKHLFAVAEAQADARSNVVCIDHASGVLLWAREVPGATERLTRWRGRGCVLDRFLCMPGDREVLVYDTQRLGEWRRIALPSFGVGDEPLSGPNNLYSSGPWLGVAYGQGIEVYSTAAALRTLAAGAADPLESAAYLVQAGEPRRALERVQASLAEPGIADGTRREREASLIALARELALTPGQDGMAVLDAVRPAIVDRNVRMSWHLARLDLFQQRNDLAAYADEQQRLYRIMEGKD